jgi:hypothetical protein
MHATKEANMPTTKEKDHHWISLRAPQDYAELIAHASGVEDVDLSTWILEVAGQEAARRLNKPAPAPLPRAKRISTPPPEIASLAETAAAKGWSLADVLIAVSKTLDTPPPKASSGSRPALRPGSYSLKGETTPAELNRQIRKGQVG